MAYLSDTLYMRGREELGFYSALMLSGFKAIVSAFVSNGSGSKGGKTIWLVELFASRGCLNVGVASFPEPLFFFLLLCMAIDDDPPSLLSFFASFIFRFL